ncbi:hypothetical protein GCM10010336_09560 [Streptomyces goshikiensis]|nr:hypothetical protein GCM10010336_09560 [Streptomyces goshikiensis]
MGVRTGFIGRRRAGGGLSYKRDLQEEGRRGLRPAVTRRPVRGGCPYQPLVPTPAPSARRAAWRPEYPPARRRAVWRPGGPPARVEPSDARKIPRRAESRLAPGRSPSVRKSAGPRTIH